MKKILLGICALGLFASCDPSKDSISTPDTITESKLASEFTYKQLALHEDGGYIESPTGNYFQYSSPSIVTIYRLNSSGGEIVLSKGAAAGIFTLKPTRGSDPEQTFYVRARGFDGSEVTAAFTTTVDVPGELSLEMKIACSDGGTKIWKWDTSIREDGAVWGNLGYTPGEDWTNGIWWGATPEDLTGQLNHSDTHVATGEESSNAYMVFSEEGTITTYDGAGNQIRKGAFDIKDYDNGNKIVVNDVPWKVGTLHTDAGTILFPFKINGGGTMPTDFEIVKLTANKLQLVYADAGTGSWSEATWWAFTSESDFNGMAAGYDDGKSWTWDPDVTGAVWGNMGYCGGAGSAVGTSGEGQWWGVTSTDEFNGQLGHTEDGTNHGDGDLNAFMTLGTDGTIKRCAADGSVIKSGTYEFVPVSGNDWKVAELNTTAGTILWPYEINSGGNMPTTFEVVYLTNDKMTLVYPDGGDFSTVGSWGEASFWHFKAKE